MIVPALMRAGLDQLVLLDADLAEIETAAGSLPWRMRAPGFAGLLQAIMGQQISSQAAAAIWRRLALLPGALHPGGFMELGDEALRGAGLSRPKIAHARSLAAAFIDGRLDAERLAGMDNVAAIAAMTAVSGLGPWTAEIYLVFALERQDVFPAGDLALAAATMQLKRLPSRPKPAELRGIALIWAPHRALAARLLWHYWRFQTGRPSVDDLQPVHAPRSPVQTNGILKSRNATSSIK